MKIKQIRLTNIYNNNKEVILDIPIDNGCIINLDRLDGFSNFIERESVYKFFKVITSFLSGRISNLGIYCDFNNKDNPIEVTIVILSEGKEYSYNGLFFLWGEFFSESLYIDHKLSVYYDKIDGISIGSEFEGSIKDKDRLIEFFSTYDFNKSFIFERLIKMYSFLSTELKVLDMREHLTVDNIIYNLLYFSKDIRDSVRKLIPELGFDIIEVTEDWRVITEQDSKGVLGIESQGSGFKTLLYILPDLIECYQGECYSKCLVILGELGNLHCLLLRKLIKFLDERLGNKKEIQIIYSSNII